jgi:hypothetical protein
VPTLDKVSVDLMVVLGTTSMPIHQVMRLSRGAIIELDATEADEVKILANTIATGSRSKSSKCCRKSSAAADSAIRQNRQITSFAALSPYG